MIFCCEIYNHKKKIPNITLSTSSIGVSLSQHKQRRGFSGSYCLCGCRGCTAAQALGSGAGVHSWSWTCASSEGLIDGEFTQEFSGARLEWFHQEQMLTSELETVQAVHHIELVDRITAEYTFKSMQSFASNWWFHSLKSCTCFLDFDLWLQKVQLEPPNSERGHD